ncbi:MAG: ATP-binding protein [Methanogenium sp.]|nr:ATP-binding protein [Methanogenium sp.]
MSFTLKPVKGGNFVNRTKIIREMISEFKDKNSTSGFALYGSRRIGKTSILKEVQRRLLDEKDIVVVYFSVWDLIDFTLDEFCRKLSLEIIEAYRPHIGLKYRSYDLLKTPLVMLRKILSETELKVVYDEIEFIVTRNITDDNAYELIEHAFSISENLSEKCSGNIKCVIMIDEFPSVIDLKSNNAKIGEAILRKIRTISEDFENTAICVSGSVRSTMNLAVLSPGSPFYRQLIVKEILPLSCAHTGEILSAYLEISDDCIREIYDFSAGIPFYIQYIGKMLERSDGGRDEIITIDKVRRIESEFLEEEGNLLFREEFNSLSSKEKLIVLKLAEGYHSPKDLAESADILSSGGRGEKISNVNTYLTYLIEKGSVVRKERGYYTLSDPVFERWLKEVMLKLN